MSCMFVHFKAVRIFILFIVHLFLFICFKLANLWVREKNVFYFYVTNTTRKWKFSFDIFIYRYIYIYIQYKMMQKYSRVLPKEIWPSITIIVIDSMDRGRSELIGDYFVEFKLDRSNVELPEESTSNCFWKIGVSKLALLLLLL